MSRGAATREPDDEVAQAALDRALDDDENLLLVYQPIHAARGGAIYAVEALLRQRRESGEIREASIIHETAEESPGPELFRLDSLLVKKAYVDAARWHAAGFADLRLNVNLSPREFEEGNVIEPLNALIGSCGIDASRVNLEITETSYIEHPEDTMHVLETIRNLGVGLWLDDFGTGHSSLTHLQHFPLDGVKIGGAFIRPLMNEPRCQKIVRSIITLAHDLGFEIIAEEVENESQLDFLLEHDCDYIQGFLFSRPMCVEDLEEMLKDGKVKGEE